MSNTRLLVVRHGQSQGNVDNLFCGHYDTPLTRLGRAQARAAGRRLATTAFDAVIASDLTRTMDTAGHILEGREPLAAKPDSRLREMNYGDWEARPAKQISQESPELLRSFFQGGTAPGGETVAHLRHRLREAIHDAVAHHRGGTLLVVSHGNAIAAMLAEFLGLAEEATWAFACDNTSITHMQFSKSDRFTLLGFNDFNHTIGLTADD